MDQSHFKLLVFLFVLCTIVIIFFIEYLSSKIGNLIRILTYLCENLHKVNIKVHVVKYKKKNKVGAGASALLGEDKPPINDSQRFTVEALSVNKNKGIPK